MDSHLNPILPVPVQKEISSALFISERTVKFHVSALMQKLGASNRTEAVKKAIDQGLIGT